MDDSNKFTTTNCVYYSPAYTGQRADAAGDDGGAQNGFSTFSTPFWYRGNMAVCSSKGMRLPTLYESAVSDPGGGSAQPTANGTPTFNKPTGVPLANGGSTWGWTATTYTNGVSTEYYYTVTPQNGGTAGGLQYNQTLMPKCVLP